LLNAFGYGFFDLLGCEEPGTENYEQKTAATTTNAIRIIAALSPENASEEFFAFTIWSPVLTT